jgi:hypothetical protein
MPSPPSSVSNRLKQAAAAERALLARRRERIERARAGVRSELERLERELADIDEHLDLLVRIAHGPADAASATSDNGNHAQAEQTPSAGRALRGPAIRMTAVRLLVEHEPRVEAIHYRDWYRLLQEHGFAVAGKKPLAVFLSQVRRSPLMRKGTASGVYALDRDVPERLRRELSQLEAELRGISGGSSGHRRDGARRRELVLAIGRCERALEEALPGLPPTDDGRPERRQNYCRPP